jgi:hypothetical protein
MKDILLTVLQINLDQNHHIRQFHEHKTAEKLGGGRGGAKVCGAMRANKGIPQHFE